MANFSKSGRRARTGLLVLVVGAVTLAGAACSDDDGGDSITVYSGRNEGLIGPLLEDFAEQTGIGVRVRYGDSAELALLLAEEGDRTEADAFISQSPGAVSFLDGEGMLGTLPDDVLELVPEGVRAADGSWVGLSGRQRVIVYNTDSVDPAELPDSVLELTEPEWKGRVAIAPTNGSFQDFVTAMRSELGDDATRRWLEGIADNDPQIYANNNAIVQAVGRGEVDVGLVNHYYNFRLSEELGDSHHAENHYLPPGDVGSLLIVTAAAPVAGTDQPDEVARLVEFLLGPDAQTYFTQETYEYPLAAGVEPNDALPPLEFETVDVDYEVLGGDLRSTLQMIRDAGLEG